MVTGLWALWALASFLVTPDEIIFGAAFEALGSAFLAVYYGFLESADG